MIKYYVSFNSCPLQHSHHRLPWSQENTDDKLLVCRCIFPAYPNVCASDRRDALCVWRESVHGGNIQYRVHLYNGGKFVKLNRIRNVIFNDQSVNLKGQFSEKRPGSRFRTLSPSLDFGCDMANKTLNEILDI